MTSKKYVVALDQGTTSTRCIIFGHEGLPLASHQMEHAQITPHPGWVEHDALEIWFCVQSVIREALRRGRVAQSEIAAVGITNQRETTVVWEADTGKPVCNAIVWQCTRTRDFCDEWLDDAHWRQNVRGEGRVKEITGLLINTYFSGTKIRWILDNIEGAREKAEKGELLFGTIDTWLIWNLTGGRNGGIHVTDVTNASRTLLMNIRTLAWDQEMLDYLQIPRAMLPEIRPSSYVYGYTCENGPFGAKIPIAGDLGDQQAALFGQTCFDEGSGKNTYGTGSFMLMNIGAKPVWSRNGLLTTVAYSLSSLEPGDCAYALEGSIAITGAAVQWLRDNLRVLDTAADSEYFAGKAEDTGGVYFVPAFSGLFAPYWDMEARGVITGLTRHTRKEHLVRATLESICYQTRDVLDAMKADSGIAPAELKVDGGAVKNNLLMQLQADLLGIPTVRPTVDETTALGAAYAAGLATGFWSSPEELKRLWAIDRRFEPQMEPERRNSLYSGWLDAVGKSKTGD